MEQIVSNGKMPANPLGEGIVNSNLVKAQNDELDALIANAALEITEKKPDSFIVVKPFGQFVSDGLKLDEPTELARHLIVEHETTIFFGDTGLGKTTYAMQQAIEIARLNKKVLYVDFELSQKQVAKRFIDYKIPENLLIATVDYSLMHDVTDQSLILAEIEKQALENEADVIFIDNLTNLCINAKEGDEAGKMMLRLISLKKTHNWTMVILAHVPKRKPGDPITLNDLAGSKIISNLADNVTAINKSKLGKDKRYLIQLKYRSFPIELDSNNVQTLTLTTSDGYLHFEHGDYDKEYKHLPRSRDEKAELEQSIVHELKQPNGLSYRKIADKLDTTLGMVQRVAKEFGLSKKAEKTKD